MTDALDIKWDEPPSRSEDLNHLKRFAAALAQRPGEWARYVDRRGNDVVRPQLVGVLKGMGLEATSSSKGLSDEPSGMCNLWARVPVPEQPPQTT